jgi:hypothetical protein
MLSSELFNDIFIPPLIKVMRSVEHNLYHLDGPTAMQHLDTLLDIKELHAIEWVAGDGTPGQHMIKPWVPLLKKIQAAKKSFTYYVHSDQVLPALRELRGEGMCINTRAGSEDEARELLQAADRMYGVKN